MSVISNYDQSVLDKESKSSKHKVPSSEKDRRLVVNELMGQIGSC